MTSDDDPDGVAVWTVEPRAVADADGVKIPLSDQHRRPVGWGGRMSNYPKY